MDSNHNVHSKVPIVESFYKSQVSSVIATGTDFSVFFILSRLCGMFYVHANVIGAITGAVVSFFLGRHWAFRRKEKGLTGQAIRYIITSGLSVFLNTAIMYWITESFGIEDYISKIIAAILMGVFFNFFMFRYFVYR